MDSMLQVAMFCKQRLPKHTIHVNVLGKVLVSRKVSGSVYPIPRVWNDNLEWSLSKSVAWMLCVLPGTSLAFSEWSIFYKWCNLLRVSTCCRAGSRRPAEPAVLLLQFACSVRGQGSHPTLIVAKWSGVNDPIIKWLPVGQGWRSKPSKWFLAGQRARIKIVFQSLI